MREYLHFDSMFTPRIITVVYWILLFVVVVMGARAMMKDMDGMVIGLLFIPVGFLAVRITCELLILAFKIHENVKKLAEKQ
jgi:hypothetical protein